MERINLREKSYGFSLIEISIVLAIMGIIIAVSFPAFSTFKDENAINSQIKQITTAISFMRQLAIDEGADYRMYIYKDINKYSIRKSSSTTDTKEWNFENNFIFDNTNFSSKGLTEVTPNQIYYFEITAFNGLVVSDTTISLISASNKNVNILLNTKGELKSSW